MRLNRLNSPINRTERSKLNENFDKLERSYEGVINDSQQAKELSLQSQVKTQQAIDLANDASVKANSTYEQLQNLIIESGTSDAELIASRTDTEIGQSFNSLPERLDTQHKEVTDELQLTAEDLEGRGLNLKKFGAAGDKIQDDTAYIQGLIDELRNNNNIYSNKTIDVPAGNYLISSTITMPAYLRMRSNGIVKFTFTGTGALFHVYNDKNPQQDGVAQTATNVGDIFSGTFILQGQREAGQIGILLGEENLVLLHVTHTAWTKFSNIYIERFDIGIKFTQIQTYITRFENVTISNCNTIIADGNIEAQNAGELITWNNCAFHNSDVFMRVTSEINHSFVGCSIDYNTQGVIFSANRYNTQRFTNCWIEASDSDLFPFAISTDSSTRSYLAFEGCLIYFRDKKAKNLCKGRMAVMFNNNEIILNRYEEPQTHSFAEGAFLFDDEVRVVNVNAPIFHENPIAISRKYNVLNYNANFDKSTNGSTSVDGYSLAGNAVTVINNDSFSGANSLSIAGGNVNYVNITTDLIDVSGVNRIYGQAIYKSNSTSINITTRFQFFEDDGVTLVETASYDQNVSGITPNTWYALKSGFISSEELFGGGNFVNIPPGAAKMKATLILGNLTTNAVLDCFVINGV